MVGIDLAGVPHRPSGICVLRGLRAKTCVVYSNQEIINLTENISPHLVTVDAPLSLPPGRRCIKERNDSHFRLCDEQLKKRGIPFFPITLGPMRKLTQRGIRIRKILERRGHRVLEIYPGGAQDIWALPRAKRDLSGLKKGLVRLGIKGLEEGTGEHEMDAVTGALVGRLYLQGKAQVFGDFSSGAIIMPSS